MACLPALPCWPGQLRTMRLQRSLNAAQPARSNSIGLPSLVNRLVVCTALVKPNTVIRGRSGQGFVSRSSKLARIACCSRPVFANKQYRILCQPPDVRPLRSPLKADLHRLTSTRKSRWKVIDIQHPNPCASRCSGRCNTASYSRNRAGVTRAVNRHPRRFARG